MKEILKNNSKEIRSRFNFVQDSCKKSIDEECDKIKYIVKQVLIANSWSQDNRLNLSIITLLRIVHIIIIFTIAIIGNAYLVWNYVIKPCWCWKQSLKQSLALTIWS